jgi:hypothetical protein
MPRRRAQKHGDQQISQMALVQDSVHPFPALILRRSYSRAPCQSKQISYQPPVRFGEIRWKEFGATNQHETFTILGMWN